MKTARIVINILTLVIIGIMVAVLLAKEIKPINAIVLIVLPALFAYFNGYMDNNKP